MKYIQDENVLVLISGLIFCCFSIWWIRSGDLKEMKKLEKENLEMDSGTKMRSWRVYIISGIGFVIFLFEILKRIYKGIFE